MKLAANYALSTRVRRAFVKFGADVSVARRRRDITTAMMAERLSVARTSYGRVERVDPRVAIGTCMMTLFVLGHGAPIKETVDPRLDETGTLLQAEKLPKPVRPKREPQPK